MRSLTTLICLIFSSTAFTCESLGDRHLLKENHKIVVDVYNQPVIKLLVREIGPTSIFSARVADSFAGFDCEVVDVTKLGQGCWEVRVEWSPGADYSGCDIEVSTSSGGEYEALLYMDYHAHL